ncbi:MULTISPECIES: hypothetical protein [Brucella]|uniref:hypothetical protein n=1 Tax=Brucella TaxID=234 RepID=UPI0001BA118D|nr:MULTISPECIES: hypothetical protein [Brucella]EEY27174.1 predicted protein [Brucella sp. F5/99]
MARLLAQNNPLVISHEIWRVVQDCGDGRKRKKPGTKPGFEVLPDLLDYLHFWIAASAAEMPFRE